MTQLEIALDTIVRQWATGHIESDDAMVQISALLRVTT